MPIDRRKKNINWNVVDENDRWYKHGALLPVLMDIRDELKQLNQLFACYNFTRFPHDLSQVRVAIERLDRRFAKRKKLK